MEDPHQTLETLAPYVLTSHVRDGVVWNTPEGAAEAFGYIERKEMEVSYRRSKDLSPTEAEALAAICGQP